MVTFLLIVSFLLHLAALAAIYRLFMQLQAAKKQEPSEIIELLEIYLQEIREENERLSEALNEKHQPYDEEKPPFHNDKGEDGGLSITTAPDEHKHQDFVQASLEAQVLQLHQAGIPIEEISKRLNCGIGEAEIIIRLHQK